LAIAHFKHLRAIAEGLEQILVRAREPGLTGIRQQLLEKRCTPTESRVLPPSSKDERCARPRISRKRHASEASQRARLRSPVEHWSTSMFLAA
jgi:hypothetical protein